MSTAVFNHENVGRYITDMRGRYRRSSSISFILPYRFQINGTHIIEIVSWGPFQSSIVNRVLDRHSIFGIDIINDDSDKYLSWTIGIYIARNWIVHEYILS